MVALEVQGHPVLRSDAPSHQFGRQRADVRRHLLEREACPARHQRSPVGMCLHLTGQQRRYGLRRDVLVHQTGGDTGNRLVLRQNRDPGHRRIHIVDESAHDSHEPCHQGGDLVCGEKVTAIGTSEMNGWAGVTGDRHRVVRRVLQ